MINRGTLIKMALIYREALHRIAENPFLDPEANAEACKKALFDANSVLQDSDALVGDSLRNQK